MKKTLLIITSLLFITSLSFSQSKMDLDNLIDRDSLLYAQNKEKPYTGKMPVFHHVEYYSYLGKIPETIDIDNILNCLINSSGGVLLDNIYIMGISNIRTVIWDKFSENDKLIISVRVHKNTKYGDYKAVINEIKMADAKRIPDDVVPKVTIFPYDALPKQLTPIRTQDTFEPWDAPPPPPSGPQVKFIPYDKPPVPLTPIRPKYPEIARESGIEGTVYVQVFIDKKGRVKEVSIVKGIPNTGLNEAAMDAIRKTRFRPAKQRERAVGVYVSIPVHFKLTNQEQETIENKD